MKFLLILAELMVTVCCLECHGVIGNVNTGKNYAFVKRIKKQWAKIEDYLQNIRP